MVALLFECREQNCKNECFLRSLEEIGHVTKMESNIYVVCVSHTTHPTKAIPGHPKTVFGRFFFCLLSFAAGTTICLPLNQTFVVLKDFLVDRRQIHQARLPIFDSIFFSELYWIQKQEVPISRAELLGDSVNTFL